MLMVVFLAKAISHRRDSACMISYVPGHRVKRDSNPASWAASTEESARDMWQDSPGHKEHDSRPRYAGKRSSRQSAGESSQMYVEGLGEGRPQGTIVRHVRRSCGFSDWLPSQAHDRVHERGYEGSLCPVQTLKVGKGKVRSFVMVPASSFRRRFWLLAGRSL
jgi:hypothetical protein